MEDRSSYVSDVLPASGTGQHEGLNVAPLWTMMHRMVPPLPDPKAQPTAWHYQSMKHELLAAVDTVAAEDAERRVLVLVNRSMAAPFTTDTIYAGLQIVAPGEVAPAHRHRAFALRFIIEGSQGFTAVEGENMEMFPGDVILTPSWTWHDHGNKGVEPVIWLDGLDLPLWQFLPANFLQHYEESRYPSRPAPNSHNRFPWDAVAKHLDQDKSLHALHLYRRSDGLHLSKTVSAQAERVSAGHTTAVSQECYSYVYHVKSGQGFTSIANGRTSEVSVIEWKAKDTFAVPCWSKVTHTCTLESGSAYLFAINDRPIVDALTSPCG
ncbi:Gentisate 1,2-dioxygenase [Cyphellophora attinorum]|uniref:Gentisate 1,2-dioxygenase n=1 Tax=Cyphellophora attinorum TaxID=1664694 RepID=A0A0N1H1D8_9EURO|nr:Gentisate 1,2-dioxygenase [Phialophora attinorum]KPI34553.1 Gentisate 1,2-dioxygenase [Phialophora attinorum]